MLPLSDHHKTALLKAIQREWDALMSVVERLSPDQMTMPDAGGWSPKDNLAHLTEWMKVRRADDPQKRPLVLWILGDTSEHFAEHRASIEKILK